MCIEQNRYGFYQTKLWELFKANTSNDTSFRLTVERVCKCATDLSRTITQFFPTYTIHDGTHIVGVCEWMYKLLGDSEAAKLSASEVALLLMSASCHDIGMAVDNEQKVYLKTSLNHPSEEELREYVRKNHHIRVSDQINKYFDSKVWDDQTMAVKCIDKEMLAALCKSHGEDLAPLNSPLPESINLNICAVLLRLSDALDYDSNRAPEVLIKFLGLENSETKSDKTSFLEHLKTGTGKFEYKKGNPIRLVGSCDNSEVYNELLCYIKWLIAELEKCDDFISNYAPSWKGILPTRVTDNMIKRFSSKTGKKIQGSSLGTTRYSYDTIIECIDGLIGWVSSLQCHWGAFNKSKIRKNANTAEGLLAYKICGYDKKKSAIYKEAIIALLNNANENGWQSLSLNKETTQCTALSLFLFSLEKENPSGVLDDKTINYNMVNQIADCLWKCRNQINGWGLYIEESNEDACNYVFSGWALIALSKYKTIADSTAFSNFCQLFYERSYEGKFGYYDSSDPKLISTALFVCLFYMLQADLKDRIRKGYNIKEAIAFVFEQLINYNVMVEAMMHYEDDETSLIKAPWYNITIGVAMSALSLAYSNGDLSDEQWSALKEFVFNSIIPVVHNTQAGKYYQPHDMPDQRGKIHTYPSFHLIWGLQMLYNTAMKGRNIIRQTPVKESVRKEKAIAKQMSAKEAVKEAVSTRKGLFTISEIADLCPQVSLRAIRYYIDLLCKQGVIEKTGKGKTAKFFLP